MTRTLLLVYRPRQDDTCPVARRLSRGPMRVRKGGGCYIHYANIHVLVSASVQQDLLTSASFLGCGVAQVEDRHA